MSSLIYPKNLFVLVVFFDVYLVLVSRILIICIFCFVLSVELIQSVNVHYIITIVTSLRFKFNRGFPKLNLS